MLDSTLAGSGISYNDTIRYAAHRGMGALAFKFVDINASRAWVNAYYNTFVNDQELLTDYQTNPNIAVELFPVRKLDL